MSNKTAQVAQAVKESMRGVEATRVVRAPHRNTNYEGHTLSATIEASTEVWSKLLVMSAEVKAKVENAETVEKNRIKRANRAAKHARRRAAKRLANA